MDHSAEHQILTEIQSGNTEYFEYLFFKYYSELCRYALVLLKNKNEAEEIVQETFIKLWERRNDITIEASLKSYLYKTVHNQCLNLIEHHKVHNNYSQKFKSENHDILSPLSPEYPVANLLLYELDGLIKKTISELPDQCREVFIKVRHDELSYSETAEKLGVSINTVKTQLQRAMSRFREVLKDYFPK